MDLKHGQSLELQEFQDRDLLTTPKGSIIEQSFIVCFLAINNEPEYKNVIAKRKMVVTLGVTRLHVQCDSLLVVSQVNREYTAKDERMAAYLQLVLNLRLKFLGCNFMQIAPILSSIWAELLSTSSDERSLLSI